MCPNCNSYDLFFEAEALISDNASILEGLSQIQCDIIAGKILYSDYMIYYYEANNRPLSPGDEELIDHFSQGEVDDLLGNENGHLEVGLEALLVELVEMEQDCPDYDTQNYIFDHSISIDINDLRLILAKDYIRRGEYPSARDTIEEIINSIELTNITFILNNQSSLLEGPKKIVGDFEYKTINANDVYQLQMSDEGYYSAEISVSQSIPCNFNDSFDDMSDEDSIELRDELFECVNGYDYFNSNSSKTFKYRFVDGDYDSNIISNQESSLPSSCSSSDSYRSVEVPYNSFESIILEPACFNSCSSSCD